MNPPSRGATPQRFLDCIRAGGPWPRPILMRQIHQVVYAARWILLIVGVLCLLTAVTLYVGAAETDPIMLAILAVFFITQWLFLLPRRGWKFRLARKTRPMKLAIALGALVMACVSCGLLIAMWELFVDRGSIDDLSSVVCASVIVLMWMLWAIVFYLGWRGQTVDRYSGLALVARWMITGTFAELLVVSPVFALVDDPDDCYCARGSFFGLFIGVAAMLWIFGPGIVLLFLQERQRRLRSASLCSNCGYDLHATQEAGRASCPECGAATEGPPIIAGTRTG